jgi:hypothetical protein
MEFHFLIRIKFGPGNFFVKEALYIHFGVHLYDF